MITFYMLPKGIATIFVNVGMTVALTFNSPVKTAMYGGNSDNVFLKKINSDKTVVFKPLKEKMYSNLFIVTKKRHYNFYIKETPKNYHSFLYVEEGKIDNSFSFARATKDYSIFRGKRSIMFKNLSGKEVEVSGINCTGICYLNGGAPVILNDERIFN